jgi:hypothetical protein
LAGSSKQTIKNPYAKKLKTPGGTSRTGGAGDLDPIASPNGGKIIPDSTVAIDINDE